MGVSTLPHDLMSRLVSVLREPSEFFWNLSLIGEDQVAMLAQLAGDLTAPKSTTGDGKFFDSGFAYWGIEPTVAWIQACSDPMYPVMRNSIESFLPRWERIEKEVAGTAMHYVSLGPGDGHKDNVILTSFQHSSTALSYIPVDMSAEMLRMCIHEPRRARSISHDLVLPIQLDFGDPDNLLALKTLLGELVGDEPILYSLLGNTLSNFRNGELLLSRLSQLLRPQDRFVLELATTRTLGQQEAAAAAAEYARSAAFRTFVTSALLSYTDIPFDMDSVHFDASIEDGRAIVIKVIYRNGTGTNIKFSLAGRHLFTFPADDTIRLHMTRKHLRNKLDELVRAGGMVQLTADHEDFGQRVDAPFGMDLLLLKKAEGDHVGSVAEALWPRR
jgi:L-histidine Nalpha-methyltransferase